MFQTFEQDNGLTYFHMREKYGLHLGHAHGNGFVWITKIFDDESTLNM
jgi:hypothetical protein